MAGGDIIGVLGVDRNDDWASGPAVEVSIHMDGTEWRTQVEDDARVVAVRRDFTLYETVILIELLESVLRANNKTVYHPQTCEPIWVPRKEIHHGKGH